MKKGIERRRYPRFETELPLDLAVDGYAFRTTTENVSCIGAYCHLDKYLPPFTKIAIKLTLPIHGQNRLESSVIACNGVIVRTEDDAAGGFNIAIFFNEIREKQKQKISRYLSQFLPY
ncbi:MAG: PilZ domain-containing protein [Candidatus Omnitrophica bacterium]|nr:PilZ domain-containing protein [Candidatus Omnitrophota bacterium]